MKILPIIYIFFVSLILVGCGPGYSPVKDVKDSYELLFDLPENVEIISEEFLFEMDLPEYRHYAYSPPMQVTATYEIKNNRDETNISFGLPFTSTIKNYNSNLNNIKLMLSDNQIYFDNVQHTFAAEENQLDGITYNNLITHTSFENVEYNQLIYKYKLSSENVKDVLYELEDTDKVILYNGEYTWNSGKVTINLSDIDTIVYSFDNELSFVSEDAIVQEQIDFSLFIDEIEPNEFMKQYVITGFMSFIESGAKIQDSDRLAGITTSTYVLFFDTKTITIPKYNSVTIQIIYPFWASYNRLYNTSTNEEFILEYNFCLDSERYIDNDIAIAVYLITDSQYKGEYIENNENLIFDNFVEPYLLKLEISYVT
jgi:hypothetical protein